MAEQRSNLGSPRTLRKVCDGIIEFFELLACLEETWWLNYLQPVHAKIKCECPSHIALEALSVKPKHRTPLDRLGFPQRCCCCQLRVASIFICIISFIWGAIELQCADRALAGVLPERDATFKYCKLVYMLLCVLFMLACGGLMFGIIIRKEQPILVFVWYAFIFNCLLIVFTLGATLGGILTTGDLKMRQTVKLMLRMIWSAIFFYLLMVVNSYKLAVWYLTLGFGIK